MGKYELHPAELGVDLMTGSAHKFHGPRGVGILYAAKAVLDPSTTPMTGGGQEKGCRGGTENVAGIVGTAVAFAHAVGNQRRWWDNYARVKANRDIILNILMQKVAGLKVNGDLSRGLYNTLSVVMPNIHAHALIQRLDEQGVEVAGGSACSKGKPSEVLAAMGLSEYDIHSTIRISLSEMNTTAECTKAADIIARTWNIMVPKK
jgi:cysteine desulfurase